MDKTYETFFRHNYNDAYQQAFRLLRDEEACKDVVSDAFELLLRFYNSGMTERLTASYLISTVKNKSIDEIRKRHSRDRYACYILHHHDSDTGNDLIIQERKKQVDEIMNALDRLTPKTLRVMKACFVEKKKYREVAEEMGISKSTVKKHVMDALRRLREQFDNPDK